jgi:hypothetical protein
MSTNRHTGNSNHPKPKKLIDESTYSPNSIGGRVDLQALRDKLFCEELNVTNHNENVQNSETSLQGKGKEK